MSVNKRQMNVPVQAVNSISRWDDKNVIQPKSSLDFIPQRVNRNAEKMQKN